MTWTLLGQLTGTWNTTIRDAALDAIPILEQLGITAAPAAARITTLKALHERAAAAGITITGITNQIPRKDGKQDDTPEIANLKTDTAISPQTTPNHDARPKCLNVRFRHSRL
jgi:hypothetical protein